MMNFPPVSNSFRFLVGGLIGGGCLFSFLTNLSADEAWQTQRIHRQFFTEGASAGDINGDGLVDIVAGPIVFLGPDFQTRLPIAPPRTFPIEGYSDQFFSEVVDANGDGASDVLVLGFPGREARLYVNPGHDVIHSKNQDWEMIAITGAVDNESPAIMDLIPGGLPEIVCGRDSQYGYYQSGEDATKPWTWTPVTRPGACAGKFAHGLGVGDVNGDGRNDLIDKTFWWEQPDGDATGTWEQHRWATRDTPGGAQIHVGDVDGDGDADIITSLAAHAHGLAWFEQTEEGEFVEHTIMGATSIENDYGVVFSQLHAVKWIDMNKDGLKDIVTGKRWMAHRGKDADGLREPVLYWFECQRDAEGETRFIPHEIDNDSGVGTDVLITDLNGDAKLDIVSSSKRGLAVHFQNQLTDADSPQPWNATEGRDQSKYANGLTPTEAAGETLLPDGFTADLIASEPELTQPIAMCFDARGRIWVVEGHTYPQKAPEGKGRDRIVFFEDTDADGSFETKRTFLEGVNLASGIEVGFGGVWIGAAPELLFIPDADHDGTPDGPPQVLLDGWGYQDTHETLNSFTWGPDGWLYGCHGVFTHSKVGKPGCAPEQRQPLNAGVWRYHPTQHRFEVFAHGTSNPWGVDFNEQGDWFISACVIPHLYHVIQGGRYQRQAGQHFNPYTFDDLKTIADHSHFAGNIGDHAFWGDNRTQRRAAPLNTSMLGGGHAHCGLAIYNADVFPESYRGDLFFHNLHGHRVVRESVQKNGSTYVGLHRPDFSLARDHKEIGVGIMVGPDGALYTSDWHDLQTCHHGDVEIWDRTDGRLFRIRYGDVRPQSFDLCSETNEQLVGRLGSDNAFFARQAQRILQERSFSDGALVRDAVGGLLDETIASEASSRDRLRAVWTKASMGAATEDDLRAWSQDEDPYVRSWAIHFVGERVGEGMPLSDRLHQRLVEMAKDDNHLVVQRYLAALLQRLPAEQRWGMLDGLVSHEISHNDANLPLLIWYGMEPLATDDPTRVLEIAKRSGVSDWLRFAVRRIAGDKAGRSALVRQLAGPKPPEVKLVLRELLEDAKRRGGVEMPLDWPAARDRLIESGDGEARDLVGSLAVQYGDTSAFPLFRELLSNRSKSKSQRLTALASLRTGGDRELPATVLGLLDDPTVSAEAVAALVAFDDEKIVDTLLKQFDSMSPPTKTAAFNVLTSRKSSTARFVDAMQRDEIDPQSVPAFIIRQAVSFGDVVMNERIEKVWGRIASSNEDAQAAYAKYRAMLTPESLARADAAAGRLLYEANCGACHRLFGEGEDIGPDVTGANRTSRDYWLENILEPNALIGRAYQMTTVLTVDSRVIAGIVVEENEDAVTLQTATERTVISVDEIEEQTLSIVSLMPSGQLEPMTDDQVRNLFAYLMSPSQVARPGEKPIPMTRPSRPDALVIEAESIQQVKVTQGNVSNQNMRGFGNDWSGDDHLWWTDAREGARMSLDVSTPMPEGQYDVTVFFTLAPDYAQVEVVLGEEEPQSVDLYDPKVVIGGGLRWEAVPLQSNGNLPLQIQLTGHNERAVARWMIGIDRIEFTPRP